MWEWTWPDFKGGVLVASLGHDFKTTALALMSTGALLSRTYYFGWDTYTMMYSTYIAAFFFFISSIRWTRHDCIREGHVDWVTYQMWLARNNAQ